MTERPSTARSRDLGKELIAAREAAGFSGLALAKRLGWPTSSKITRIEQGKQGIDEIDLVSCA